MTHLSDLEKARYWHRLSQESAAEVLRLRAERDLYREAHQAAELHLAKLQASIARVQGLLDMQHVDRLIRVGDIRDALKVD